MLWMGESGTYFTHYINCCFSAQKPENKEHGSVFKSLYNSWFRPAVQRINQFVSNLRYRRDDKFWESTGFPASIGMKI
ncbi:hypothetical protein D3C80_620520 [compost metagenome]